VGNVQAANEPAPAPGSTGPQYQVTPPPLPIDPISIVLGFIAFIAVIGLLPLWIAVLQAWFPR
jgi:hypothetical protein